MKMITNQSAQNPGTLLGKYREPKAPMKTEKDKVYEAAAGVLEKYAGTEKGAVSELQAQGLNRPQISEALGIDVEQVNKHIIEIEAEVSAAMDSAQKKAEKQEAERIKRKKSTGWL